MKATKLALVFGVTLLAGCSKAPVLYPVRGELTAPHSELRCVNLRVGLNEVIPCANLEFIPEGGIGQKALATTDLKGCFTLETPGLGQGAIEGIYRVVVKTNPKYFKKAIPSQYQDEIATPLRVEVVAGGTENLKINLAEMRVPTADDSMWQGIADKLGVEKE